VPSLSTRLLLAPALAAGLLVACAGRTTASSGAPDGAAGDGAACVSVELSSYDQSCNVDADCVEITSGSVCNGSCQCGGSAINVDGESRYRSQVAGITAGECPCFAGGNPTCVDHTCTLCSPGPGGSCGVIARDAGAPSRTCVNVDASTYDQSCAQDSDCIDVTAGMLCSGECACGGSLINVDGQARYAQAVASIVSAACGCPTAGVPTCVQDRCVFCGIPGYEAPGCPDGG